MSTSKGGRPRIPDSVWERFDYLRGQRGYSLAAAAREVGVSKSSAYARAKDKPHLQGGRQSAKHQRVDNAPDPRHPSELSPPARRATGDFAFFLHRYFGLTAVPWQVEAAKEIAGLLETRDEEYCVINVPPGAGKSTLFTRAIPTWLIVRDRSVRIQIGSKAIRRARDYTRSIRRELSRPLPQKDAEACLMADFGRFQPFDSELWANDEFIVEQVDGTLVADKEPTVLAISQESDFLGARADFVIWDDLVDTKNSRTIESREALFDFWQTMAESRLEPGGLLVLQGQRIGPNDLYDSALGMLDADVEDPDDPEYEGVEFARKYHHIVYPAHDEEKCDGRHGAGTKPWPDGCLLDPVRLSWRKLSAIRRNDPQRYQVVYQQRSTGAGMHLVDMDWIEGGWDPESGEQFSGCLDRQRDWWQVPGDLGRGVLSIVTADPSPTKYWAIQWWLYDPDTERRILVYSARRRMGADGLLDERRDRSYTGELEKIREEAKGRGYPVRTLIVERNAAQNFLAQYRFFTDWLRMHGINLIKHNTSSNKSDEHYGVSTIGKHYRLGRVRLPYSSPYAVRCSKHLIDEVTVWPEGAFDDQVMAHWFLEWNLSKLKFANRKHKRTDDRPSWVKGGVASWLTSGVRRVA